MWSEEFFDMLVKEYGMTQREVDMWRIYSCLPEDAKAKFRLGLALKIYEIHKQQRQQEESAAKTKTKMDNWRERAHAEIDAVEDARARGHYNVESFHWYKLHIKHDFD